MFIENTDALKHNRNLVACYESNVVRQGNSENCQFLRKYRDGHWELVVSVSFNRFIIPIQEHQAQGIISGQLGNIFDCQIINHTRP